MYLFSEVDKDSNLVGKSPDFLPPMSSVQLGRYVYLSITTSYNADLFIVNLLGHVHPYEYC